MLRLFGHEPDRVVSFCGAEQEYFLVDRHFFLTRPDLLNAGRTLFGSKESLPTTFGRSRSIKKCFTSCSASIVRASVN